MPTGAMGFIRIRIGSAEVLTSCNRLHVGWIHTVFNAAKVINIQSIRYLSLAQFVRHAMSQNFTLEGFVTYAN